MSKLFAMTSFHALLHCFTIMFCITLQVPEAKIAEFANSVDLDEVAHNEPPHLDLHYFTSSFSILNML